MSCDLLIIGAGPAGMAAAITARQAGLSVVVADENQAAGGQVYRAVETGPLAKSGLLGADYTAGRAVASAFAASGAQHLPGTAAFMIEPVETGGFTIGLATPASARMVEARHVLIAIGALERPFPIPGWTLPGVMTAGAAQTLLKTSGIVPVGPTVLAGSGPLLYLLAAQYARAGVKLAAILDTTPRGNWRKALAHLPGFLASPYFLKGLRLLREAMAAHRILRGITALEALGESHLTGVKAVTGRREVTLSATTLLLHQGVVPHIHLAMAAGAAHSWNPERLAFEPELRPDGETSVPGLFIAGDSAGIGGAVAAQAQGECAALAILDRLEHAAQKWTPVLRNSTRQDKELEHVFDPIKTHHAPDPAGQAARRAQRATAEKKRAASLRGRAFLDALYRPAPQFRMPDDDVIVCRCEEVTAGDIRRLIARGTPGPNQMKAFTRAGMGPCQGRSCGLTITELFAQQTGRSPQEIGHLRLRAPVKPITVGQMAGLAEGGNS